MNQTTISLSVIFSRCWQNRKRFIINFVIVFVLAAAYILCIPRYYSAHVRVAPEETAGGSLSSLSTLASNFGFDIGGSISSDAISPELYPDLFQSNDFMVDLMSIGVRTADGSVQTNYYTYLTKHLKTTPWHPFFRWLKSLVPGPKGVVVVSAEDSDASLPIAPSGRKYVDGLNPFQLTLQQSILLKSVMEKITCSIDKKTGVITIGVVDQDPYVAATLADSVRVRLQEYITAYRTNKAHVDVVYYESLVQQSLEKYKQAQAAYAAYADSHKESVLASVSTTETNLENEMEGAYSTYNALRIQLQNARAKVQERTPAFSVLEVPTVPVKPAGPKRMLFVGFMCILSVFFTGLWLFRSELKAHFSDASQQPLSE